MYLDERSQSGSNLGGGRESKGNLSRMLVLDFFKNVQKNLKQLESVFVYLSNKHRVGNSD